MRRRRVTGVAARGVALAVAVGSAAAAACASVAPPGASRGPSRAAPAEWRAPAAEPGGAGDRPAGRAMADEGGAWAAGPALPEPIAEIAAATLDGSVYTGGGFTPPGAAVGRWFGRLDVGVDHWVARAPLPRGVHHHGLVAASGRIWLAGGYTGRLALAEASDRLDAYDPATDRWMPRAAMPGRRAAATLLALDGRLYVAGGEGDAPERMWVYDIAADAWSDAPGPTRREHLGGAVADGRLFVVAGRGHGLGDRSGILEAFDPRTGIWERLPDMPGACGGCAAAATADGRIHVTGGETFGAARATYRDHYVFDPAARSWHVATEMPTARHGIGAAAVGARFLVVGGGPTAGLAYTTTVEIWSPADASPPAPPTPTVAEPTPTAGPTVTVGPRASPTPTAAASTRRIFMPRAERG